MNKSDFDDNFYLVSVELKTNILIPHKKGTQIAIVDALNALNEFIENDKYLDITSITVENLKDTFEERINYISQTEDEKEDILHEMGDENIA